MRIGFHASHEQFAPSKLLDYTIAAEQAGFDCAMSSDHFKPWSRSQGHSGYSWSWLGAAMARTKFPVGVICAAGYRYHPAVVAQAAATLAEMFPDRFWLALGSGERVNEDVTGLAWPTKPERNEKMSECAQIIRALLKGERVTHRGSVTVVDGELFSRPKRAPLMLGAAVTEATAEFVGGWSDGLLTVAGKPAQVKKVIDAFRRGGGEGKPIHLQVALNWAPTESEALQGAFDHWRFVTLGGDIGWELRSPEDYETATRFVRPEDMRQSVLISSDLSQHAAWLHEYAQLGVDHVYLHQVDLNQRGFLEAFAKVLPQLRT
ncbi:TIGR03885 family FMN-dependent LLM class oxidoreductase [Steroidobacter agaridevorans]|uniref:TIGR03885 family FMN-dependent LLM class oxidoreductase n=1 Tax=Steroidobacter agaridevorans TaxID=2695856 RepID=UPI00132AA1DA|nr:TIGR03885 family FMN-dependent LLM class oxidoreductase [Steroidobacter agaridevorans]GFE86573.1 LLM class F420-dependent oxidoreductase [Steroidobacter agaridevorans]